MSVDTQRKNVIFNAHRKEKTERGKQKKRRKKEGRFSFKLKRVLSQNTQNRSRILIIKN